ncbi:DUF1573 domain-containing protein [Flavobacterium sp. H122]|uniref:DUF1573 domain-containing protein n=1 Tax=Flavobacterium sp. H122 TaxID=2529860 RepID=UPI0010AAA01D|nr:DUF1573 domain-containing protein [Flavobacterium sp. H122]
MRNLVLITLTFIAVVLMSFSVKELVVWKTDVIDSGTISQGVPKTFEFVLTNESSKDLVITSVRASCGCTASEYTKEVIKPNSNGVVKAVYNASVKGAFNKVITVYTSVDSNPKVLTLKGVVN